MIAAGVLLLAGCGSGNVSLQPGQWETTTRLTSIEAPGMPAPMLAQMRTQMGQPQTQSSCITPEQAANPAGAIVNPGPGGPACQFSESTFAGGVINVRGTCPGQGGQGAVQMSLQGSYTATTMEGTMSTAVQGGPQSMTIAQTMSSRRTGDCTTS